MTKSSSLEAFTYAFRHFVEALHNQDMETRGSLLRLSVILAHESAELAAKSLTGRFKVGYEELFKHAFSHALGRPITSESKRRTYFDEAYEKGGLLACSNYRECLMYALTHRMLELTRVRNRLYHEGGHVVGLEGAYKLPRDVCAYMVNLYGVYALLEIANQLPSALRFCFLLYLNYFQEVETGISHKGDLAEAWNALAKKIHEEVHEEAIRFMERLFEGDKYAIEKVNDVLRALRLYGLSKLLTILKDRVLTTSWHVIPSISPEEKERCIIRGVAYTYGQEEVNVALDYWDGRTTTITLLHKGSELCVVSECDKEELHKFLLSAEGLIVKICIEKLPFKYIISALRNI